MPTPPTDTVRLTPTPPPMPRGWLDLLLLLQRFLIKTDPPPQLTPLTTIHQRPPLHAIQAIRDRYRQGGNLFFVLLLII